MKIAPLSTTKFRARPYEPRDREAILEIEKKRHAEWREQGVDLPLGDPADPNWVAAVVIVDENDRIVGAIGGRQVIELGSTIDATVMTHELRDGLMRAWAKLVPMLYRKGFDQAYARVSSPTPAWARMLERRARFLRDGAPHFYFDLEAACSTLKPDAHS